MTQTVTEDIGQMTTRSRVGVPSQEGPVLLATKPFNGLDAPLLAARLLAIREDRPLRVVSVLEQTPTPALTGSLPAFAASYQEWEREALAEQIRRELAALGDGPASEHGQSQVEVIEGPSARSVVEVARRCDARVIVVGTGKHAPIGRYIYRERALQVIRLADRPVLVVPPTIKAEPTTVAVAAVDFSAASMRAARAVLPMLSAGGRLILVHVKTGVTLNEETAGWWNDAYERRCIDRLAQFERQLPVPPDITIESKFLRGDVVRTTLEYARSRGAELIACGRLGHSLLERVFLGSVSAGLVREATCPVLVAPELPCDVAAR